MNNARYTQKKVLFPCVNVCFCLIQSNIWGWHCVQQSWERLIYYQVVQYVTFSVSDKTKVIKLNTATSRGSTFIKNVFFCFFLIYIEHSVLQTRVTIVIVMGNLCNIKSHFECFISVNDYICSSLTTHKIIPSRFPVLYAHGGWIAADFIF